MNNRDEELDALLKPLRGIAPNEKELGAWRAAVRGALTENVVTITRNRMFLQVAAAVFVGVLIGGFLVKGFGSGGIGSFRANSVAAATFEITHVNLD